MEAKTPAVVIYTTTYCGYCHRPKMFMEAQQVPFAATHLADTTDRKAEDLSRAAWRPGAGRSTAKSFAAWWAERTRNTTV